MKQRKSFKVPKWKTRGLRKRLQRMLPNKDAADQLALKRLREILPIWLPDGRFQGEQYVALNPTRDDRNLGSFQINIQTGLWADFATEDKGRGAVSLAAYIFETDIKSAIKIVSDSVGELK